MIAIDVWKLEALDADRNAMRQINFLGNLDHPAGEKNI